MPVRRVGRVTDVARLPASDPHGPVARAPGATPERHLLVERALTYLGALRAEAALEIVAYGLRTADIMQEGKAKVSTSTMGEAIVRELDKYIVGQNAAKRAVAIALRNRWRRQQLPAEMREEIAPKNIITIGPTGAG